ncbi:hypothetical protein OJ253_1693 [Cryptosporidium canis]|uniref:Uncharacterized protein n=1 Tax=Cryptosporidium canis TaxID=195482 RepID=A0A9D5DIU7_9CRYT|nr:hypothetical protein OJ253_1693 [Cryptosporidium canis]
MKEGSESGLLLEVPFTSPISTINSIGDWVLVGTWDGYFYQVSLDKKETVRILVQPSYPIRYISALRDLRRSSDQSATGPIDYELILGGVYRSRVGTGALMNSPLVLMEELGVSSDTHYQIVETNSSLARFGSSDGLTGLCGESLRTPLFLFTSAIISYFGFRGEDGGVDVSIRSFRVPDREFVVLDCDYLSSQLVVVERSPERLDYYALCSLQVLELPGPREDLVGEKYSTENINLADLPPKYLLNFPFRHPFLITSNIRSELMLSSSSEYKDYGEPAHIYKYLYPTMFSISDFDRRSSSPFKSMYNLCNAKFWGSCSLVFLVSNHTIIGVDLQFSKETESSTFTKAMSRFCIKSPDRNITSFSTSNPKYIVAVTEKNRVFLSNRKGEIVHSINRITPSKYSFRWVWPVHVSITRTGTVLISTTRGLYYISCDLLNEKEAVCDSEKSFSIHISN